MRLKREGIRVAAVAIHATPLTPLTFASRGINGVDEGVRRAQVGVDGVEQLQVGLLHLVDRLLDRRRHEVDVEAQLHDEHALLDTRAEDLEPGVGREGDLPLVWVLREELDGRATCRRRVLDDQDGARAFARVP